MIFTEPRTRFLAEILKDVALVFFASVFLGPLLAGGANDFLIVSGLLLALSFWYASILFVK